MYPDTTNYATDLAEQALLDYPDELPNDATPQAISDRNNQIAKINTASMIAIRYCDRYFRRQQVESSWYDLEGSVNVQLPMLPVAPNTLRFTSNGSDAVTYRQIAFNSYQVRHTTGTLTATYTAGYAKIPDDLQHAVVILMQGLERKDYQAPHAVELPGLLKENIEQPLKVIPYAVKQLLMPYRRLTV